MDVKERMNFSLFLASRGRPELLIQCVSSFFLQATHPQRVEMIVVLDHNDPESHEFDSFAANNSQWDIKTLKVRRSTRHQKDYNNRAAMLANGDVLWVLNDDCKMETKSWDEILASKIPKGVYYVSIDDSTHVELKDYTNHPEWKGRDLAEEYGCCFPLLTREAYHKLGCFFPEEIEAWGADLALYSIFKPYPQKIIRIPEVKILHHSWHNGTREKDDISENVKKVSKTTTLNTAQLKAYSQKLL